MIHFNQRDQQRVIVSKYLREIAEYLPEVLPFLKKDAWYIIEQQESIYWCNDTLKCDGFGIGIHFEFSEKGMIEIYAFIDEKEISFPIEAPDYKQIIDKHDWEKITTHVLDIYRNRISDSKKKMKQFTAD